LKNSDCDDSNPKTVNICQQQKCLEFECIKNSDCDDEDPETTDTCVDEQCKHVLCGPGGCCITTKQCQDDGNPCTLEFCDKDDPEFNGGNCQFTLAKPCTIEMPLVEEWENLKDAPGGMAFRGWEVWSNPSKLSVINEYNWQLTGKGPLGPDMHMRFRWVPVAMNYSGCLLSPLVDSFHWYGANVLKQEDYMTMQFEHSGRVSHGSATLDVFAFEATEGATTPPPNFNDVSAEGWRWSPIQSLTFDQDFDRQLVTWDLSGPPHYESLGTRYAFCIRGTYTYDIYDWSLDSINLRFGLPPYWGGAGSPAPPTSVSVVIGQKKEVELIGTEDDLQSNPFLLFLTFHVKEGPEFATIKNPQAKYEGTPKCEGCPAPETFQNWLVIDVPASQKAGSDDLIITINDDFFATQHAMRVHYLLSTGSVIWQPKDVVSMSGKRIAKNMKKDGKTHHLTQDLLAYSAEQLAAMDGVFVILGNHEANHLLSKDELTRLEDALKAGAKVYMEGGQVFGDDVPHPLHKMFNVAVTQQTTVAGGPLIGRAFLANPDAPNTNLWPVVTDNEFHNRMVDRLDPKPGTGAFAILRNGEWDDAAKYNLMVAYEHPTLGYRTVASSISYAAINNNGQTGLKYWDLLSAITTFFDQGLTCAKACDDGFPDSCVCDDSNPCTADSCNGTTCENQAIDDCTACLSDLECASGQACSLGQGVCVKIPGTANLETVNAALDKPPITNDAWIYIQKKPLLNPLTYQEINVQVKVHHPWRGQLQVELGRPDQKAWITLKEADPNDGNANLFETYGVGITPAESYEDLMNQIEFDAPLNKSWVVRIKDTVPGVQGGTIEEVSVYVVE
jgi:hypothetical protein